jgi:hypothetical protein
MNIRVEALVRSIGITVVFLLSISRAGAVARHQNVTLSKGGQGAQVNLVYAPEGYTAARTLIVPVGTARAYQYLPSQILHDFGTVNFQPSEVQGLRQASFQLSYGTVLKSGATVHLVTLYFRAPQQPSVGQHGISGAQHAYGAGNDVSFQLP